jgi:hypothetical protein
MERERVDHLIGAPSNRASKAAQRPICGKSQQSTISVGLVECVEHELEKRQ